MTHPYPDDRKAPRHTSRGIVINGSKILLMERWSKWGHYFSMPGGGIEANETPEQAAEREIFEETSVKVEVNQQLYDMDDPAGNTHQIFLCKYISGEPSLQADSEEAYSMERSNQVDRYEPKWVDLSDLDGLYFGYWALVANQLMQDIKHGWPKNILKLHSES